MTFDFSIVFAAGLFGSTRHALAVELTPCHDCPAWRSSPHAKIEAIFDYGPNELDFFEAYMRGAISGDSITQQERSS